MMSRAAPARLVDYDGRRFAPAERGAGSEQAVGTYHQDGDIVWAEFAGGTTRVGRLVGSVRADGTIYAAYCFVTAGGETISGACVSTPTVLVDGRLRLTERWRRLDGSTGVSLIDELSE